MSSSILTAIDMFCGCGGISCGLRSAGFRIIAGADIQPSYICTFKHNFPEAQAITDDLSSLEPSELMGRLGLSPGELDLLAGGPPCQGFSKNVPRKSRHLDLPNNMLVRTFLLYVEKLRPKLVLMENVAEMKNGFDSAYTNEILTRLSEQGYEVTYEVLNAADYGIPQRRRRAFFLATRIGQALKFPTTSHKSARKAYRNDTQLSFLDEDSSQHVSVWDAIGDLPSVQHNDKRSKFTYATEPFSEFQKKMRGRRSEVANHKPRPLAPKQYQRLASIQPGQGIKDLPEALRPRSGYSGAYGRLTKTMIAPTITRWVFHPGSGRFGHPQDTRVITIREAARLQGFPGRIRVRRYLYTTGWAGWERCSAAACPEDRQIDPCATYSTFGSRLSALAKKINKFLDRQAIFLTGKHKRDRMFAALCRPPTTFTTKMKLILSPVRAKQTTSRPVLPCTPCNAL